MTDEISSDGVGIGTAQRVVPYATTYAADKVGPAGIVVRFVAWLIDWFILFFVRVAVMLIMGLVALQIERSGYETDNTKLWGGILMIVLLYLVAWPYYAVMEASKKQATLGKLTMGLRVDDVDGGRVTFTQTSVRFFIRAVSAILLGAGFLMSLFHPRGQTLHDIAANCVVVYDR